MFVSFKVVFIGPFLRIFCRFWSLEFSRWLDHQSGKWCSELTSKRFSRYDKYWDKPERLELNT